VWFEPDVTNAKATNPISPPTAKPIAMPTSRCMLMTRSQDPSIRRTARDIAEALERPTITQ
jgi:hypothetical protein